jgi:hypothetical protein
VEGFFLKRSKALAVNADSSVCYPCNTQNQLQTCEFSLAEIRIMQVYNLAHLLTCLQYKVDRYKIDHFTSHIFK